MGTTHKIIRRLIGHPIQCHTMYGTFHGVVVHCTKQHLVLGAIPKRREYLMASHDARYGPGGPYGPGPGGPHGPGPGGPHGPGGWQFAIPLAAILGITALGMHWW